MKKIFVLILILIFISISFIKCNTTEVMPAPMIYPKYHHTINELKDDIYVIGGFSFGKYLSITEIYRSTSNRWINSRNMNINRGQHRSVVYDEKLYVTGGQNRSGVLNECEMLDPTTTWKRIANLNNARYSHNIFVLDDNIYVAGGIGYFKKPVMETEVYNSKKNIWEIVTKMKYPVIDGKGIAINDVDFINKLKTHNYKIDSDELAFVFGGYNLDESDNLIPSEKVQYYDPKLNKWFDFTSMNTKKAGHSINFVNGKFYVIGGLKSPHTIEMYNPDVDKWETISELQIGRTYHTTVVKEDSIYIIGGKDIEENVLDNMALFNTITLQRTKEQPLSYPRYKHTSMFFGDKMFVIGGIGDFSLSSIEYYNFEDKKWVSSY